MRLQQQQQRALNFIWNWNAESAQGMAGSFRESPGPRDFINIAYAPDNEMKTQWRLAETKLNQRK